MPQVDETNLLDFCGWGRRDSNTMQDRVVEAKREADATAAQFAIPLSFRSDGIVVSGAGKSSRLDIFVKRVTGKNPRIGPQSTGDCVAMASMQAAVIRSCVEISQGDAEQYRYLFAPFHYATSRVIVGKNRLRGGAGSVGGWVSEAMQTYGYLDEEIATKAGLKYGKKIADAWGDDRPADGKSFRDFFGEAKQQSVRRWTRAEKWEQVRDALYHKHPFHICSDCGYTMKPNASGFHMPSGQWPHDMCVYAYWENVRVPCVGILNSWGDVHGTVNDPETKEPLPPGTLLVPVEEFTRRHLQGSECIAFSDLDGFDATIDWSQFG